MEKFNLLPNGGERRRCHLLGDTFICEVANLNDFEAMNARLARLRTDLDEQFSSAFSLHTRNAPLKIRGPHNASLAKQILEA